MMFMRLTLLATMGFVEQACPSLPEYVSPFPLHSDTDTTVTVSARSKDPSVGNKYLVLSGTQESDAEHRGVGATQLLTPWKVIVGELCQLPSIRRPSGRREKFAECLPLPTKILTNRTDLGIWRLRECPVGTEFVALAQLCMPTESVMLQQQLCDDPELSPQFDFCPAGDRRDTWVTVRKVKRMPGGHEDCNCDEPDGEHEENCKECAEVLQPERWETGEGISQHHHRHHQSPSIITALPNCPCPKKRSNCVCIDTETKQPFVFMDCCCETKQPPPCQCQPPTNPSQPSSIQQPLLPIGEQVQQPQSPYAGQLLSPGLGVPSAPYPLSSPLSSSLQPGFPSGTPGAAPGPFTSPGGGIPSLGPPGSGGYLTAGNFAPPPSLVGGNYPLPGFLPTSQQFPMDNRVDTGLGGMPEVGSPGGTVLLPPPVVQPLPCPLIQPQDIQNARYQGVCSWMLDPLVNDPESRSHFLQCQPAPYNLLCGRWQRMPCPPSTTFDVKEQLCIWDIASGTSPMPGPIPPPQPSPSTQQGLGQGGFPFTPPPTPPPSIPSVVGNIISPNSQALGQYAPTGGPASYWPQSTGPIQPQQPGGYGGGPPVNQPLQPLSPIGQTAPSQMITPGLGGSPATAPINPILQPPLGGPQTIPGGSGGWSQGPSGSLQPNRGRVRILECTCVGGSPMGECDSNLRCPGQSVCHVGLLTPQVPCKVCCLYEKGRRMKRG